MFDNPAYPILMLPVLAVLLALSGFFSGCETAFFSLTSHHRLQLSRGKTIISTLIIRLLRDRRRLLITLMLGNMLANVSFFTVATILLLDMRDRQWIAGAWMWALNLTPLLGLILFGEVLPKLAASGHSLAWARAFAMPLMIMHRAFAPVRIVCAVMVIEPLARLIAPPNPPQQLSPGELQMLMELSQQRGVIDHEEEKLLKQVLSLSRLHVADLMTPRIGIIAFDLNDSPADLLNLVRQTRCSRIPVYRGDLDHIEGMVYRRQVLLRSPRTGEDVRSLIRQTRFIPELQRADHLLVDLRKLGATLAIAVDEYGGTAGLVTLEDVVKHMFWRDD